jgi:uncharacterized protein YvpB
MALAYLGIFRSQQEIGRVVKIREKFGTPAPHIVNLRSLKIDVLYRVGGILNDVMSFLDKGNPVIAFVQTSELPHWTGSHSQHAALIVGMDEQTVILHDPALAQGPTSVPIGDFLLAWDEMDNRYAVIMKRTL